MVSPSKRWQVRAATSMDRLGGLQSHNVVQDLLNVAAAIKGPRCSNYKDGALVTRDFTPEDVASSCVFGLR